jgi:hypothetical protein
LFPQVKSIKPFLRFIDNIISATMAWKHVNI